MPENQNSQGWVCSLKTCIHSLNKCFLSPCYVPGTILGEEDRMVNKTNPLGSWSLPSSPRNLKIRICLEMTTKYQTNYRKLGMTKCFSVSAYKQKMVTLCREKGRAGGLGSIFWGWVQAGLCVSQNTGVKRGLQKTGVKRSYLTAPICSPEMFPPVKSQLLHILNLISRMWWEKAHWPGSQGAISGQSLTSLGGYMMRSLRAKFHKYQNLLLLLL